MLYCFLRLSKLVELSGYNERSVTYSKTATSAAPNALAELTRYVITLNKRSWHRREYLHYRKRGFLDLFMSVISKDNDKFKSFKSIVYLVADSVFSVNRMQLKKTPKQQTADVHKDFTVSVFI